MTICTLSGILGSNGWNTSDVEVNLSASDFNSGGFYSGVNYSMYQLDGGLWTRYTGNFTIASEGAHSLCYYSIDKAGNAESPTTRTVKIDKTAPSVDLTYEGTPGLNGWWISDVVVSASATDGVSGVDWLHKRAGGMSGWTEVPYTSPLTFTSTPSYTVLFIASDLAGNTGQVILSAPIDRTPPATTCTLSGILGSNGWNTSDVEVNLSASDFNSGGFYSGVNYSMYQLDGGLWTRYTGNFTIASEGAHSLCYYSIDKAGNAESPTTRTVKIDKTAPSVDLTYEGTPGLNGWWISDVVVSASATDGVSGVDWLHKRAGGMSGWTEVPYTSPLTFTSTPPYNVWILASDLAGNIRSVPLSVNIDKTQFDSTPPVTSCTLAGTAGLGGWNTSNVAVDLSATDAGGSSVASVSYKLDSSAWVNTSGSHVTFTIATNGIHTLQYYATDVAGNQEAPKTITVKINKAFYPVSLLPADGATGISLDAQVRVTFNAPIGTIPVTIKLEDQAHNRVAGDVSASGNVLTFTLHDPLAELTTYTATVTSTNPSVPVAYSWDFTTLQDTIPPVTTISITGVKGANDWYTSNVTVNLNAFDADSGVANITYRIVSSVTTPGNHLTLPFYDGSWTVYYYSTDLRGNKGAEKNFTIKINKKHPSVSLTYPQNDATGIAVSIPYIAFYLDTVDEVDPSTIGFTLADAFGNTVPGTFTYESRCGLRTADQCRDVPAFLRAGSGHHLHGDDGSHRLRGKCAAEPDDTLPYGRDCRDR